MIVDSGWLRLESRAARLCCAGAVFIVSLATYLLTLAPTVTLVDSGELIVAARTLGVAHPPGFPLYILLAHLATLIPIGSVAVRVNAASAVFAALGSAALTLVVSEALLTARLVRPKAIQRKPERSGRAKKGGAAKRSEAELNVEPAAGSIVFLVCLATGLMFAFSRTLWAYATIAEVYTLNTLLIAAIFVLMFRWRRGVISEKRPRTSQMIGKQDRWLDAAAFLFGLGLGVHHVSVGLMLPALAWLVLSTEGLGFFVSKRLLRAMMSFSWLGSYVYRPLGRMGLATEGPGFVLSKRLLRAAVCAFVGLAIYIYLPLSASRSPVLNWGDPRTLQRFWWHITGRQYQVFFTFSSDRMGHQLGEFFRLVGSQFGPWFIAVGLLLASLGAVVLFKRDRTAFWFLGLVIACDVIYSTSYEIAEDKDAYYLPAFLGISIASAFAADWLLTRVPRATHIPATISIAVVSLLLLLAPTIAFIGNLPFNNRSRYFIAHDYVENIFNAIEPGGMLLTRDWQVYSPMIYVHEIERTRNDVVAIDINQLRRTWYFDHLSRAYPTMIEQARDKVDAFLEDLTHWEQDPDLYQRDVSLNQRINSRFYEMIRAFVTDHMRKAPVYVTQDLAINREGADAELTKWLSDTYQFVPQGLVFQVAEKGAPVHLSEAKLVMRGLADGSVRFEADDVVKVKVIPVYVGMLYNRGRYLAATGRNQQAIESFRAALDLQPNFLAAQQAIDEALNAQRRSPSGKAQ